jgi:hypothetical protein
MHHGNNKQHIVSHLVNNSIRKPIGAAAASPFRKPVPGLRVLKNSLNSALHFDGKIQTQSLLSRVVKTHRFSEFLARRSQEFDVH